MYSMLLLQRPQRGGIPAPPDTPTLDSANAKSAEERAADAEPVCSDTEVKRAAAEAPADPISPYDLCTPINNATLATAVADLCYENAAKICEGPLERWPGTKEPGALDEWTDEQLKGMRCLGEMIAVVESFWDCLPKDDRKAACDKVLEFKAPNNYVRPSDDTIALCEGTIRCVTLPYYLSLSVSVSAVTAAVCK
jgi:hypothetical protein